MKSLVATFVILQLPLSAEAIVAMVNHDVNFIFWIFFALTSFSNLLSFCLVSIFASPVRVRYRISSLSRGFTSFKITDKTIELLSLISLFLLILYLLYIRRCDTFSCIGEFANQYRSGNIIDAKLYTFIPCYVLPVAIIIRQILLNKPLDNATAIAFSSLLLSSCILGLRFALMSPLISGIIIWLATLRITFKNLLLLILCGCLIVLFLYLPKLFLMLSLNPMKSSDILQPLIRIQYSKLLPSSLDFISPNIDFTCIFGVFSRCDAAIFKNSLQPLLSGLDEYHPTLSYFSLDITGIAMPLPLVFFYSFGIGSVFANTLIYFLIYVFVSMAMLARNYVIRIIAWNCGIILIVSMIEDSLYLQTLGRSLLVSLILALVMNRSIRFLRSRVANL